MGGGEGLEVRVSRDGVDAKRMSRNPVDAMEETPPKRARRSARKSLSADGPEGARAVGSEPMALAASMRLIEARPFTAAASDGERSAGRKAVVSESAGDGRSDSAISQQMRGGGLVRPFKPPRLRWSCRRPKPGSARRREADGVDERAADGVEDSRRVARSQTFRSARLPMGDREPRGGETAPTAEKTAQPAGTCGGPASFSCPEAASKIETVPSTEAVASRRPSGENARARQAMGNSSARSKAPEPAEKMRTFVSLAPSATRSPRGRRRAHDLLPAVERAERGSVRLSKPDGFVTARRGDDRAIATRRRPRRLAMGRPRGEARAGRGVEPRQTCPSRPRSCGRRRCKRSRRSKHPPGRRTQPASRCREGLPLAVDEGGGGLRSGGVDRQHPNLRLRVERSCGRQVRLSRGRGRT